MVEYLPCIFALLGTELATKLYKALNLSAKNLPSN